VYYYVKVEGENGTVNRQKDHRFCFLYRAFFSPIEGRMYSIKEDSQFTIIHCRSLKGG
jgi:hypothetical protein